MRSFIFKKIGDKFISVKTLSEIYSDSDSDSEKIRSTDLIVDEGCCLELKNDGQIISIQKTQEFTDFNNLEFLKEKKLQELEEVHNESKKITIQNGRTLVIKHNSPKRKHFLNNLPKVQNWSEISFFDNYKHSNLEYWQEENGKIYGFSADSIIWSEVFSSLFVDQQSKTLIFARNKKFYEIYKNQIINAKNLSDLENISFENISSGIVINIKNEAEIILQKFKPSLLSITAKNTIKKTITEAIKSLQDGNGEIHLIKEFI